MGWNWMGLTAVVVVVVAGVGMAPGGQHAATQPATLPGTQPAVQGGAGGAVQKEAERMTYKDPSYGFSMGVPKLGGAGKERAVAVLFAGPPENATAPNINVLVDPGETTLEGYVAPAVAGLKDAKMIGQKVMEVSGRPAELLEYERTANGRTVHILQLVVVGEGLTYVVTCTCAADTFGSHEAEFRRSLESFRLPAKGG